MTPPPHYTFGSFSVKIAVTPPHYTFGSFGEQLAKWVPLISHSWTYATQVLRPGRNFSIASPIIKILAMLCRPATMDLNLERRKDFTLLAQTLMSTFFRKQSSCLGVLDVGWSVLLTLLSQIFIVQYFRPC